jgi:hypothetical protein
MKRFSLKSSPYGSPTRSCMGAMRIRKTYDIGWLRDGGSAVSISVERVTFWGATALATGVWTMFASTL